MALKISVREALGFFIEKAKEWGMSPIPDADRLQVVLDRMRKDVSGKRNAYLESLAAVVAIQDPEDLNRGQLPALRARLEKYERKGKEWGAKYSETTSRKERGNLMTQMQEASVNITSVSQEIASLEKVLETRKETLALREEAYRKAKAEYEQLRSMGPSLVAQAKALREAKAERTRAIEASAAEATTDTGAILAQLEEALEEARADERAAELIAGEADEVTLDEIIAAEEKAAETDATITGWIG